MRRLSPLPPQRAFELSQEEAEEWYRGRDVYPQTAPGQDETIVTFRAFRWAGEARRLPTEEQLSARTGARWKTFAGSRQGEAAQKCALFDWRFRPIDYAEK